MVKKINILVLLLLVLMSVSAVSAADDINVTDNNANSDILEISSNSIDDTVYSVSNDDNLESNSHTITQNSYSQYFDNKGNLIESTVESGDTIYLDGSLSELTFKFTKPVNIVGTSSNKLQKSVITLFSGASGSTVSNLNIVNTADQKPGVILNSASYCTIKDCTIVNKGASSYPISLINGANYNNVTGNDLKSYGVTYGHGTRSTPALIVSGSHYNYIADNNVVVDDANGIYLSSYSGGDNKGGLSNFNVIYNNGKQ